MTNRTRYFEDFALGERLPLGTKLVMRDEVIAFASEFDAQPMHLDEQAAAQSLLGGLSASGWHTASMFMRLLCDGLLLQSASRGAPGIEQLEWLRPVRPGDTIAASAEVLDLRPSRSRPEIGSVQFKYAVSNQTGSPVMVCRGWILFLRREAA